MHMSDQQLHDKLVREMAKVCHVKFDGERPVFVGWSIRDCLDHPTAGPIMSKILEIREKGVVKGYKEK